MSILETLTEGIVNRNMEAEGAALLDKWTQTGLLEGLNESQKSNMAVLLENQAKSLLKESSSLAAGDIQGFAAVAFPNLVVALVERKVDCLLQPLPCLLHWNRNTMELLFCNTQRYKIYS